MGLISLFDPSVSRWSWFCLLPGPPGYRTRREQQSLGGRVCSPALGTMRSGRDHSCLQITHWTFAGSGFMVKELSQEV